MDKNKLSKVLCALAISFGLLSAASSTDADLVLTKKNRTDWQRFLEEHQTHKLMLELSARHIPQTIAIVGVNVVPMTDETVLENQTVIVKDGKFTEIGPLDQVAIPKEALVIREAAGKYLIPGLTEGHSHVQLSLSQFLVYVTKGVTSVREMDGFPWMINARELAKRDKLLIPNLYVAGHILSNRAWPFYMTQINRVDQAHQAVREQAALGYDFIKIHNSMPEPLFSAIFAAAKEVGLDVVGHIPNEITIKQAIEAGMRTNEHFKGYLYDMTLEITVQDYLTPTATSELWNAPSFAAYHEHVRGDEATKLVNEENSLRLVPRWMRNSWHETAREPMNALTELRQGTLSKKREIFTNLLQFTDKFFAGTDSGGYAFMVPGYALHEEVRIFEEYWFSAYRGLKTATINPALAMRAEKEMGTVEVGKRGDFVILDKNPLETTKNLKDIWGVGIRGTWLSHADLMKIESALERIFSDKNVIPDLRQESLVTLVEEMKALKSGGFPYPDYLLEEIELFLIASNRNDLAVQVDRLQANPGLPIEILE